MNKQYVTTQVIEPLKKIIKKKTQLNKLKIS